MWTTGTTRAANLPAFSGLMLRLNHTEMSTSIRPYLDTRWLWQSGPCLLFINSYPMRAHGIIVKMISAQHSSNNGKNKVTRKTSWHVIVLNPVKPCFWQSHWRTDWISWPGRPRHQLWNTWKSWRDCQPCSGVLHQRHLHWAEVQSGIFCYKWGHLPSANATLLGSHRHIRINLQPLGDC